MPEKKIFELRVEFSLGEAVICIILILGCFGLAVWGLAQ